MKTKKVLLIGLGLLLLLTLFSCDNRRIKFARSGRFVVDGQELFMSGMNLAWMHFGRDITEFDEAMFIRALEEIAMQGGNCLRWWIHVNGSTTPLYDDDGKVLLLNPGFQFVLEHALDLAWERGIMVVLCLWSFDMLQAQTGVPIEANLKMLEDQDYTMAYVNEALRPLVRHLKDHPAILCWEIMNEPEGLLPSAGWASRRTEMVNLQRFINLLAGGIHLEAPDALVTVGSGLSMTANVGGLINYYAAERLIAAGGDKLGTLDFYEVHYYPEHEDEITSPFHHPADYWELDKPIMIGEFPALGIKEIGKGFRPQTSLEADEAYLYAYEHGYAGALSWTWTAHDGFGGVEDAGVGMQALLEKYPEHIVIDSDVNRPPVVVKKIENLTVGRDVRKVEDYVHLPDHFFDHEDGGKMQYAIGKLSKPELLSAEIDSDDNIEISIPEGGSGACRIEVVATDSGGKQRNYEFIVFVYDPTRGNLALFKTASTSSVESELLGPQYANDGLEDTRYSSAWADDQWWMVDLGDVFPIEKFRLVWEVAFGLQYEILVSTDSENWKQVYAEMASDGKVDEFSIEPVQARYVKMHGIKRATEWGFSLWEFEVYRAE